MTPSDKLREIAHKYGGAIITGYGQSSASGFTEMFTAEEQCLSDLTALISENYYPKEFTNYCIKNVDYCRDMGKEWYQIMASGILILKTLDDVYNYWKENEQ